MKKMILKITGIMALTMLIAVNVTSTMKFSPGGQEVIAGSPPDKIPCYSAAVESKTSFFVYCLTCGERDGSFSGKDGTCTISRD